MISRFELLIKRSGFFLLAAIPLLLTCALANSATNDVERAMATDSDGDGLTDWQEWQAGTNPGDSNSCLRVTSARVEDGKFVLQWSSVSNRAYEVVSAPTLNGLKTNTAHIRFIEKSSGTGAWSETVSSLTNNLAGTSQFFRIECLGNQSFEESVMDMAVFE